MIQFRQLALAIKGPLSFNRHQHHIAVAYPIALLGPFQRIMGVPAQNPGEDFGKIAINMLGIDKPDR